MVHTAQGVKLVMELMFFRTPWVKSVNKQDLMVAPHESLFVVRLDRMQ